MIEKSLNCRTFQPKLAYGLLANKSKVVFKRQILDVRFGNPLSGVHQQKHAVCRLLL